MQVQVQQEGSRWVVRIEGDKPQVFHCATEAMARQLSSVFAKTVRPRR
jgi:hypothetical protein